MKYHPRKFRNYFHGWFLTGNLTIEGTKELNDFLLSDIMYPTFQKWFYSKVPTNLLWAGSSKTAPRILIFSIAMGADYSFYVKSIATFALTFFGYIISVLASLLGEMIFLVWWLE